MSARVPLVLGALVIVGSVAWLVLRDGASTPTPAPRAGGSATRSTPRAPIAAPAGPSVAAADAGARNDEPPRLPPEPPRPTAEDTFAAEARDERWAAPTEREIQRRFSKLRGGKLASVECRQTQCRLVLAGSEPELADTIADLEGPRGMHGFAKNVLLTSPAKQPDGSIELRAFLRFER